MDFIDPTLSELDKIVMARQMPRQRSQEPPVVIERSKKRPQPMGHQRWIKGLEESLEERLAAMDERHQLLAQHRQLQDGTHLALCTFLQVESGYMVWAQTSHGEQAISHVYPDLMDGIPTSEGKTFPILHHEQQCLVDVVVEAGQAIIIGLELVTP